MSDGSATNSAGGAAVRGGGAAVRGGGAAVPGGEAGEVAGPGGEAGEVAVPGGEAGGDTRDRGGTAGDARTVRECFSAAAAGFLAVVARIGDDAWDQPGLGSWNVRDLVGHTIRAFATIETYLGGGPSEIVIHTPLDYLLAGRGAVDHSAVAARGREAGAALGAEPLAEVTAVVERVTRLVAVTADDAPVHMRFGAMTFLAYLSTRTFELTVHSLDLVAALGIDPPAILRAPIAACLSLAAEAASAGPDAPTVLLAMTGRRGLPAGFSVV